MVSYRKQRNNVEYTLSCWDVYVSAIRLTPSRMLPFSSHVYVSWMKSESYYITVTFLNEPEVIFVHTVKWFQALLFNMNNSI